jgi:hypothetical protein
MDDFMNLPLEKKKQIVWTQGQFVDNMIYYGQRVNLYSINELFVEVFYNNELNDIDRITVATEYDIKKYIASFKIDL